MFQWQKWPSPTIEKTIGQHSPLRNVLFNPPTNFQTKQRRFREKSSGAGAGSIYKIWNHTPSWAYDRILMLQTWFYKLWVIFESGNIFFTAFIKNVSRCYRQVKPRNYFAHHNVTSSARVIYFCCSTSVDDFATNKVIYMFDFLVFKNCWCVFDSLCLWVIFCQRIYMKSRVLHTERWTLHSSFWDEWRHSYWLWYKSLYFYCDFLFFLRGVRWSLSPSSTKSLHAMDASWLTIFDVLKHTLFVRNGYKLEVFWNHNIS